MGTDRAFEIFNDYCEQEGVDPAAAFIDITGLPIWWDRVGAEWQNGRRKLVRWAQSQIDISA